MANLLDLVMNVDSDVAKVTKNLFGKLVHSYNDEDVDLAMRALESAGDYDHLPDDNKESREGE